MTPARQSGIAMTEVVGSLFLLGIVAVVLVSIFAPRMEIVQGQGEQAEMRHLAGLAAQALERGWIRSDATRPAQLRAALPGVRIPDRINGRPWRMRLDNGDPRVLADEWVVRPRAIVRDARMTLLQDLAIREHGQP